MLRMQTLGATLIVLAASAGAAAAADLSQPYTPPPAQAYTPTPAWSWTGPYVGLTGGYDWGGGTVSSNGFAGGVFGGYNWQTSNNIVLGLEGDGTLTGKSTNPWDATFRGRVGYAWDRFLAYGTAGVATGGVKVGSVSATPVGWTGGLGVEAALSKRVTGRVEWRYTDLGTTNGSSVTSSDLMLGVAVKF